VLILENGCHFGMSVCSLVYLGDYIGPCLLDGGEPLPGGGVYFLLFVGDLLWSFLFLFLSLALSWLYVVLALIFFKWCFDSDLVRLLVVLNVFGDDVFWLDLCVLKENQDELDLSEFNLYFTIKLLKLIKAPI
jgi:hypothetical protein|tara:strand:+ start:167 stop:565 length:399 start_codon:yes stop_codon:yes gene_type:complete